MGTEEELERLEEEKLGDFELPTEAGGARRPRRGGRRAAPLVRSASSAAANAGSAAVRSHPLEVLGGVGVEVEVEL